MPTSASPHRAYLCRASALAAALAAIPLLMVTVDRPVARLTVPHYESPESERLLALVDPLGNAPLVPGVGGVFLLAALVKRSRRLARAGVLILLIFGLCGGSVYALKSAVRRPRPWTQNLAWSETIRDSSWSRNGQAHSFPSGDVTCAAGLATALYLAAGRGRARYLLFLIPLASSLGRVLGARHYPSDCLAGLLLGMGLAALAWRAWPERAAGGSDHEEGTKTAKPCQP
jgi:membrane-associated phospholipid phosphatase